MDFEFKPCMTYTEWKKQMDAICDDYRNEKFMRELRERAAKVIIKGPGLFNTGMTA